VEGENNANPARSRVRGAAAIKAHATLAVGLLLCAAAFWFEVGRALGGNALSWAYVFEWPLLGGFAVYMWWKVLHPDAEVRPSKKPKAGLAPEYAGMLAAWEQHQSELAAERESEDGTDQ
jgi:hypothetical protein